MHFRTMIETDGAPGAMAVTRDREEYQGRRVFRHDGASARGFAAIWLVALLFLLVAAVSAGPVISVERYETTPSVLAPGDTGTVAVVLTNPSTLTTNDSEASRISAISLDGNGLEVETPAYRRFGVIGPGQSITVTFVVRATAAEGLYFPDLVVEADGETVLRYPVPVNVNSRSQVMRPPALVVEKAVPDAIRPGDAFGANLTVRNAGALRAHDIRLRLNTSSPYLGIGGPSLLALGDLGRDESRAVPLDFVTDRKLPLGLEKASVELTYRLPDGTEREQSELIELPIRGSPELVLASFTTDPPTPKAGAPVRVIVRLENMGTDTAKSVAVLTNLSMTGTKEAFIGKIQPGDNVPAIFTVTPAKAGDYPFALRVAYSDDDGPHSEEHTLTLRVVEQGGSEAVLILVGAGVIVGAYLLLRRRRGRT